MKGPLIDTASLLSPSWRRAYAPFQGVLEGVLSLSAVNRLYDSCRGGSAEEVAEKTLRYLNLSWSLPEADLDGLRSRKGGLIIASNHPFGGPESLVLMLLLSRISPNWRLMANFMLGQVEEFRQNLILVDPFGGQGASGRNSAPLRQALACLKSGGVLGVFPAGEVSAWRFSERRVADKDWQPQVARLALSAKASVLPLYFEGRNGTAFQLAGVVSPRLRTLMLPRVLTRPAVKSIDFRMGSIISVEEISTMGSAAEASMHLRSHVYALSKN